MATNLVVPALGESVSEATIAKLHKKLGDFVKADEVIVELETDKVTLDVNAPVSGVIKELKVSEGGDVKVGDLIAVIDETAVAGISIAPNENATVASKSDFLSPAPKKIVAENNIDVSKIQGTGKDGRITKGDLIGVEASVNTEAPLVQSSRQEERVKMTKLRQTIAQRLKDSQNNAAILTTFNEIDMTSIIAIRNEYKDIFQEKHGVKLGFMSFFVKAAIEALKAFPAVNAEINGNDIIYKKYYDIGVAVGSPTGLVVPILRDADKFSFAGIEAEIVEMGKKARDGKLSMADLTGGTFTISNGGVYGSLLSTPIINPPQSGIIGLHKIQERPMVVNGEVKIRSMMYVALSYDHRIIDGKEAVGFLVKIKEIIEDPKRLLIGL